MIIVVISLTVYKEREVASAEKESVDSRVTGVSNLQLIYDRRA